MHQPSLICTKEFVRDLADGQAVDSIFEVRQLSRRQKKDGEPFLKLQLGDSTGAVEAVVWDGVDEVAQLAQPGTALRVAGRFSNDPRYGASITVRAVRAAGEEEYDPADLHEAPPMPLEQMLAGLEELMETIQTPCLRELLGRLLGPGSESGRRWRVAPAAKVYHQAYRHGLLEHSLSVAQGVSAMAATFPAIDRDVAVTGALLHDIGKIEAYEQNGERHRRSPMQASCRARSRSATSGCGAPSRRSRASRPRRPRPCFTSCSAITASWSTAARSCPCTREATLVHMIDNLGGTLGSYDRLQKGLPEGECWTGFDRALSGSAYFAPPPEATPAKPPSLRPRK